MLFAKEAPVRVHDSKRRCCSEQRSIGGTEINELRRERLCKKEKREKRRRNKLTPPEGPLNTFCCDDGVLSSVGCANLKFVCLSFATVRNLFRTPSIVSRRFSELPVDFIKQSLRPRASLSPLFLPMHTILSRVARPLICKSCMYSN